MCGHAYECVVYLCTHMCTCGFYVAVANSAASPLVSEEGRGAG